MCRVQAGLADGELIVAQMAASEFSELPPGTAVRVSLRSSPVFAIAD